MDWNAMSPRERDALVAEKVMGLELRGWARCYLDQTSVTVVGLDWDGEPGERTAVYLARRESTRFYLEDLDPQYHDSEMYKGLRARFDDELAAWGTDRVALEPVPHYTEDIAAAWEVVEKIREKWWDVQIHGDAGDDGYMSWHVGIEQDRIGSWIELFKWHAEAESVAEAICLAALRAMGEEV